HAMRSARIGQHTGNSLHRGSPRSCPYCGTSDRHFPGVQAMPIDDRPTIAAPDDDPYLWLEDIEGERALDFVDRQSRLTLEAFIADGFTLPEAKSGIEWIDADTLLLSSALGEGMATNSGYARTVRLWRRGEPAERAPALFEVPADRMAAYCSVDDTGPTPRMWFIDRIDFFNLNLWLGTEAGPHTKLELPTDIWMEAHQDWLVLKLRGAWTVAGKTYAPDSVLG